jgi:hypothetical protein
MPHEQDCIASVPDVLIVHIHVRVRELMMASVGYVLAVRLPPSVLHPQLGMLEAMGLLQRPGS